RLGHSRYNGHQTSAFFTLIYRFRTRTSGLSPNIQQIRPLLRQSKRVANRTSGSANRPPSKNESGVTLTTPITMELSLNSTVRPWACRITDPHLHTKIQFQGLPYIIWRTASPLVLFVSARGIATSNPVYDFFLCSNANSVCLPRLLCPETERWDETDCSD